MVRGRRHRARANRRAHRDGNSRSGWKVDGEDRSARGRRPLHDSDLRQTDSRTTGRAGGRRVDLRRPVEYAVWSGAGEKRGRGNKERELSADAFLQRRRAGQLFARGRSSRRTLESHHAGKPRRPRRRSFRGGLFLRPQSVRVRARSHRSDAGRGGRRPGGDFRQRRRLAPIEGLRRSHRVLRAAAAERRPRVRQLHHALV